ncbi:DivIVA domain-containing protein [Ruminococcaceae bacterium OttesenSCG-928-A16]|nr:DivIVA domain-containing protein [Ruminococcaceae bacterium OttesenSCG-928-A16]
MTAEDMKTVTFDNVKRGYNPEDVDDFLQQAAREMEALEAAKEDAENKMYILAQKVEEYRGLEDTLKTALINAQRMGETVVREAKQKADAMVREATGQAELLKQQADQEIETEYYTLQKMRDEVANFKATILTLYKQHIESLSGLDAPVAQVDEFLDENAIETPAEPVAEEAEANATAFSTTFEETYEPVPQNFTPLVEVSAEEEPLSEAEQIMDEDAGADVYPVDAPASVNLFDGYQMEDETEE